MSKAVGIFVLSMLLLILPAYADVPDEPHDANAMWIEPSTVDLSTDTALVGDRFNVTVWINLTVISANWQFKMAYNKNHLNATGCGYTGPLGYKSQFFANISAYAVTPDFYPLNATHNYVLTGESWGATGPFRNPGYGSLAWVEFEVVAVPPEGEVYTSVIAFVDVYPAGTETYAQTIIETDGEQEPVYIELNVSECIYTIPELFELLIPAVLMSLTLVAVILSTKLRSSKNS